VLPAIPFGPTPEHRNYGAGYIDVPVELHEALVHAVLESLVEQGFGRIAVWRGCGGHRLEGMIERFNRTHDGKARAFLPPQPFHTIWCRVGEASVPGGHADSFTTSIALYLRPEAVRIDLIPGPDGGDVDWTATDLDFSRYSRTGVVGDPTHASAELGARLWEEVVEEVALLLRDAGAAPV
jgi:creatinine amidohydrolase